MKRGPYQGPLVLRQNTDATFPDAMPMTKEKMIAAEPRRVKCYEPHPQLQSQRGLTWPLPETREPYPW